VTSPCLDDPLRVDVYHPILYVQDDRIGAVDGPGTALHLLLHDELDKTGDVTCCITRRRLMLGNAVRPNSRYMRTVRVCISHLGSWDSTGICPRYGTRQEVES
jgi:hypothetical protein